MEQQYLTVSNAKGAISHETLCFGSYRTCAPIAVAPTQAASLQAAGIGCLFSAARTWLVTCIPVISTLSAKMQHIPRQKYKISYITFPGALYLGVVRFC